MADAYIIEVSGRTAGIVTRDPYSNSFNVFPASSRFNVIEGRRFSDPLAAERAAPRNGIFSPKHWLRSLQVAHWATYAALELLSGSQLRLETFLRLM
jgi:hypothetical protein